jgi:GrpB-like predicted nucleotidyltransferase (UPF0157 family)
MLHRHGKTLGQRRGAISLRDYDARWPNDFEREAATLRSLLRDIVPGIEHIGSTAVPGLAAKPILDIALGCTDAAGRAEGRRLLEAAGYEDRGHQGDDGGVVFAKGATSSRTHYLHLVEVGSVQWLRYLTLRDALRGDPVRCDEYAALKKRLASRFPPDRLSYQSGKREFIEATLAAPQTETLGPERPGPVPGTGHRSA